MKWTELNRGHLHLLYGLYVRTLDSGFGWECFDDLSCNGFIRYNWENRVVVTKKGVKALYLSDIDEIRHEYECRRVLDE